MQLCAGIGEGGSTVDAQDAAARALLNLAVDPGSQAGALAGQEKNREKKKAVF